MVAGGGLDSDRETGWLDATGLDGGGATRATRWDLARAGEGLGRGEWLASARVCDVRKKQREERRHRPV